MIVMIGLAISCLPLNTSRCIQNLHFICVWWLSTPRNQFNNFKHPISWSTLSTPYFKTRQARHFMKHTKQRWLCGKKKIFENFENFKIFKNFFLPIFNYVVYFQLHHFPQNIWQRPKFWDLKHVVLIFLS